MHRAIAVLALLALLAGCGTSPKGTPESSVDAVLNSCRADVAHANLHPKDVTALDFAIHDCASLDMLASELRANPGYLDADVTAREFAGNRCYDPSFLDVGRALVCQELGIP
jgi:hypothetical protein